MESPNAEVEALASALDLILPAGSLHDTRLAGEQVSQLTEEEQAFAATMQGSRLAEFSTARVMLRDLLQVLQPLQQSAPFSFVPDRDGCVPWPHGITGSLSHCKRVCSAVIWKSDSSQAGIGIDIEALGRLSERAHPRIATPAEQDRVQYFCAASSLRESDAFTLLFSAKEAFFKYQFAHTRLWLDFHDVEVTHLTSDTLQLRASKLSEHRFPAVRQASYRFTAHHVATAVWSSG